MKFILCVLCVISKMVANLCSAAQLFPVLVPPPPLSLYVLLSSCTCTRLRLTLQCHSRVLQQTIISIWHSRSTCATVCSSWLCSGKGQNLIKIIHAYEPNVHLYSFASQDWNSNISLSEAKITACTSGLESKKLSNCVFRKAPDKPSRGKWREVNKALFK